ncbi:FAD/NAD(P)-binding protein [Sphingopyxis sp.]|uniref:FAD/NAD(P)-binding protein n=1 Tax=Sphingopyxis sp. TaxID=1908224 RepID=UPI00260EA979|nr:FAD/NAD(P)-binding protein [Sphingopyxis sp.]MCW0199184.1 FAD/NAD(P)-binding protein [Sphingopyxis sp.]
MNLAAAGLHSPRPRLRTATRVAIVGAGFSGTMLALNLLEQADVEVLLIERDRHRMGAGVAYSSSESAHLLNVRAGNMSAFADRPGHFCDWLASRGLGCDAAFVTRATYGRYLRETLAQAMEIYGQRLKLVDDEVLDIEECGGQVTLGLVNGGLIEADRAVLAIGNLPPHDPPAIAGAHLPAHRYIGDPWASAFEEGLDKAAAVLVIGTGLTAVDVILRLVSHGHEGPITALSRRGLRPHRHVDGLRPKPVLAKPAPELSELVRWARGEARRGDWRLVVDSIRPITQMMWASAEAEKRMRFLRHLRPFWDVHRHRLAPAVADRIDALVASGQLCFRAGKIAGVSVERDVLVISWRPRGAAEPVVTRATRMINCTGPQGDLLRSADPLVKRMLAAKRIRPDALRLGLDIDRDGHVVDARSRASDHILAIGPMTRGDLWEVVAVPDIRVQVSALARRLVNAHWTGGEGL